MKTITESILFMVLCMLSALYCLSIAVLSACSLNWWCVAINILLVCVNVWLARKSYKQAKDYEETILTAIDNTLDIAMLAYTKALRMETKETLSKLEELLKDKKDEVAEDNGTPE